MKIDDIKKLATGPILFDLNRIIAPRLVTILYLLGLAGIVLWAVNHFFYSFRFGVGTGLWGLVEIVVFGLLALVILRIACEAVIVYFRTHHAEAVTATQVRPNASLIDDVREAIEELADEEPDDSPVPAQPAAPTPPPPAPNPASPTPPASDTAAGDSATATPADEQPKND